MAWYAVQRVWVVLRIRVVRLAQVDWLAGRGVDGPVPDLRVLVAVAFALRRNLWPDPLIQRRRREHRIAVERLAQQAGRVDANGDRAIQVVLRSVGQRGQVRLKRVEHAPEAPHTRDVVLDDVAVEQELACQLLDAAGATFDLEVVTLAWPKSLRVGAIGSSVGDGGLVEASLGVVPRRVGLGVEPPANAAAVQVEDVEDLTARVEDAELHRVAEVAVRRDGGRVAEGIRAVGLRLLLRREAEAVQERLGAIVHRPRAGSIRFGEGVHARQRAAAL